MLKIISSALKPTLLKKQVRYNFCSQFKKQFGLKPHIASMTKRLYRRFIKNAKRKYLIPFRIVTVGVFWIGFLIILPGVQLPAQLTLKQKVLYIIDQLFFMNVKHNPSKTKSSQYLNFLISQLSYWDQQGYNEMVKTNEIFKKIQDIIKNYPMSDSGYTALFSFLQLRVKKVIQINKKDLKNQQFYDHLKRIFENYIQFRKENEISTLEKNLYQIRKQSIQFLCEYLLQYSKNKGQVVGLMRDFSEVQPSFGISLVKIKPILKQLIQMLNSQERKVTLGLLSTLKKKPQIKAEMQRIGLIQNLFKHIPKQELKQF